MKRSARAQIQQIQVAGSVHNPERRLPVCRVARPLRQQKPNLRDQIFGSNGLRMGWRIKGMK